jgi:hypothetical protein
MNHRWVWLALFAWAGCGDNGEKPADLGMGAMDLPASGADLSARPNPIGGPCTSAAQCSEGTTPVCFAKHLYNESDKLETANGYCSARCTDDTDCGESGVCYDGGTSGKWCLATCKLATDCRSNGYACFLGSPRYCFPNANLSCDPTAPGGTCITFKSKHGGCFREAAGTGMTGYCWESCDVGAGSCPISAGSKRQCVVYDERSRKDPAASTNDTFAGGICINTYAANAVATECLNAGSDRLDACVDGAECYLADVFTNGDNLCHTLCVPDGAADGGAPSCVGPAVCTDVWGLFATAKPVGLCL